MAVQQRQLVDASGNAVTGLGVAQGALTNRSGTVTAGGTSQQIAAANAARRYLLIQNNSGGDLWVNFGTAAVATQPSIRLMPSDALEYEGSFVPTDAVHILGATTGQAYTAKEA